MLLQKKILPCMGRLINIASILLFYPALSVYADSPKDDMGTNSIGIEFVAIEAGSFIMGSDRNDTDVLAPHRVRISSDFLMGKYEITQKQWFSVMGTRPWRREDGSLRDFVREGDSYPVCYVDWNDTQAFIERLNDLESCENCYQLPTEAQWEYAARGGTLADRFFDKAGGKLSEYAWYKQNTWDVVMIDRKYGHQVGTRKPNSFGLYDMYGNVWEWCQDYYNTNISYSATVELVDPVASQYFGRAPEPLRVIRGGGFLNTSKEISSVRRLSSFDSGRTVIGGFRIVKKIAKK